ncbi:MAG: HigA family addiction module antidote protein [Alphaproteobacteria bacterium]|nr:HigA family addiction module antidote protein [Alphaproteobacteria bacterium]
MTAEKKSPAQSARDQFNGLDDFYDRQRAARRQQLDAEMSENMSRIAGWLPKILADEMQFRKQGTGIDTIKLREEGLGGTGVKHIKNIRIGVNVFQAVVSPYNQEQLESMDGFKDLVRACASPDVDMNLRVYYDRSWASTMFEIQFDVPFDRKGRYKEMLQDKPSAPAATMEALQKPKLAAPALPDANVMERRPAHPGALLAKDILPALGLDAKTFAAKLGVETRALNAVLKEKAPVTPDLAKKLSKTFGNSAQFWTDMQNNHDGVKPAATPAAKKPAPKRR